MKSLKNLPTKEIPPNFLQRPEAVFAVLAIGFLTSMTYLANASRRIFYDVKQRAHQIANRESYDRRYQAKMREKLFLESAIEATQVTIENTKDFLDKQIKRAEAAEGRLEELSASSKEVDKIMEHVVQLKMELKEKESSLEEEHVRVETDQQKITNLEADIEKGKNALNSVDHQISQLRAQLDGTTATTNKALAEATEEAEHHRLCLKQNDERLRDEVLQTDRVRERREKTEQKLESVVTAFEKQMTDIETRRKEIKAVASKAKQVKKVTADGKKAINAGLRKEDDYEQVNVRMEKIWADRDALAKDIDSLREQEAAQFAARESLLKELEDRTSLVAELKQELSELTGEPVQGRKALPSSADAAGSAFRSFRENEDDVAWDELAGMKAEDLNVSSFSVESDMEENSLHNSALNGGGDMNSKEFRMVESAWQGDDAHLSIDLTTDLQRTQESVFDNVDVPIEHEQPLNLTTAAVEEKSAQVAPKKRRGRSRKSQVSQTSLDDASTDAEKVTLRKKGRGRPRKKAVESPGPVADAAPKKRRGRPRKNSVTVAE